MCFLVHSSSVVIMGNIFIFCIFAALPFVSVFCFVFFWRSKFETGKCLGREREGDDTTVDHLYLSLLELKCHYVCFCL